VVELFKVFVVGFLSAVVVQFSLGEIWYITAANSRAMVRLFSSPD
jgi:hypothetical protein